MNAALRLIEKQIAMADFRNRSGQTIAQNVTVPGRYMTKDGASFGPCLLISRECGSGASQLAQLVGARLGWNVFDAKIVDEIAQAAHIHNQLVKSVDERVHTYWEQTLRELLLDDLVDEKYLRLLKQVVTALGSHGNVVFVGRGAQYFLPPQCGLSVRMTAPLEARAERVAERMNLSLEQARLKTRKIDAERAAFVWKTFKKDSASPINYDLIINTGEIKIESAANIVLASIQEKLGVCPKKQQTQN
jgi:cytidylate kinase